MRFLMAVSPWQSVSISKAFWAPSSHLVYCPGFTDTMWWTGMLMKMGRNFIPLLYHFLNRIIRQSVPTTKNYLSYIVPLMHVDKHFVHVHIYDWKSWYATMYAPCSIHTNSSMRFSSSRPSSVLYVYTCTCKSVSSATTKDGWLLF